MTDRGARALQRFGEKDIRGTLEPYQRHIFIGTGAGSDALWVAKLEKADGPVRLFGEAAAALGGVKVRCTATTLPVSSQSCSSRCARGFRLTLDGRSPRPGGRSPGVPRPAALPPAAALQRRCGRRHR
jgi:hypothetical protein